LEKKKKNLRNLWEWCYVWVGCRCYFLGGWCGVKKNKTPLAPHLTPLVAPGPFFSSGKYLGGCLWEGAAPFWLSERQATFHTKKTPSPPGGSTHSSNIANTYLHHSSMHCTNFVGGGFPPPTPVLLYPLGVFKKSTYAPKPTNTPTFSSKPLI